MNDFSLIFSWTKTSFGQVQKSTSVQYFACQIVLYTYTASFLVRNFDIQDYYTIWINIINYNYYYFRWWIWVSAFVEQDFRKQFCRKPLWRWADGRREKAFLNALCWFRDTRSCIRDRTQLKNERKKKIQNLFQKIILTVLIKLLKISPKLIIIYS